MNQQIHYSKPDSICLEEMKKPFEGSFYNPFDIDKLQLYNPIYQRFFTMNDNNYNKIALNHPYHMVNLHEILHLSSGTKEEKKVFIKFSPLLDPYRYMIGKYNVSDDNVRSLPQLNSNYKQVHSKILSPNNSSYVDCFFTYLSSLLHNDFHFPNGINFYGSHMGIQKVFKVSVTDDLEHLRNSNFFHKEVGKLFMIEKMESVMGDGESILGGSRKHRKPIIVPTDDFQFVLEDVEEISVEAFPEESCLEEIEAIYSKSPKQSGYSLSSSSSDNSEVNYSTEGEEDDVDDPTSNSCSDSDEEFSDSSSSEEEDEEEEIYGYIKNFPIQMICMEKCDGTLDQLLEDGELDEEKGMAMLFQVIFSLLTFQKCFQFTHNDLHTNNIMYVNCEQEFLYYEYQSQVFKVPTYGKIFKVIDFGRGIYKYMNKQFCSDSFAPGGDASTQYNCEPFLNEEKPRLDPNYSFDLCRLGTSMFDFLMDIDDEYEELDELQKIVHEWCKDDNGKNVLYKKHGDERYPSFKLYKMIARSVHNHLPEVQLERPYFEKFKIQEKEQEPVFSLDTLFSIS